MARLRGRSHFIAAKARVFGRMQKMAHLPRCKAENFEKPLSGTFLRLKIAGFCTAVGCRLIGGDGALAGGGLPSSPKVSIVRTDAYTVFIVCRLTGVRCISSHFQIIPISLICPKIHAPRIHGRRSGQALCPFIIDPSRSSRNT